eukprot:scaffold10570_cov176-Amphora_coffeaeformis.AAC.41
MKGITKKTSFRGDESNGVNADCTLPFGKLSSFRDEMAAEVKDGSITYAHQEELPRLPIPTLEETLDKFPVFLEAIQTPKEHEETKRVTHEFKKGAGPKLQEALLEYEKEGYESGEFGSYVEEFWNEAYLSPDSSVVLNLNPFFVLEGGRPSKYRVTSPSLTSHHLLSNSSSTDDDSRTPKQPVISYVVPPVFALLRSNLPAC